MSTNRSSRIDAALLVLRLGLGGIMIAHGAQKLFVFGFSGVTGAFTQMGIPAPGIMGPFIALVEFLAPIALFLGLFTRLAAFGLMCDMLGAIFFVHMAGGFFAPKGIEFPLSLAIGFLALTLAGAGNLSIDARMAERHRGTGSM
jgi:putative oxidoreductase